MCLGLAVGICVPYFTLQRVGWFPERSVPVTAIDRAIGFTPEWILAYLSIAALVPLAPILATERSELRRYAIGLALLCITCFASFVLVPVAGPRPEAASGFWPYAMLVSIDRPSNSMPSLHAGLVVYSLLFGARVLRSGTSPRAMRALRLGGALWATGILYATLATKQHWLVDLPAGAAVAWCAYWLSWRR